MQEPQYRSPGVRELLDAVAKSRVPCMSIMNMPPLPYIKRIPGLDYDALEAGLHRSDASGTTSIPTCLRSTAPTRRRSVRRTGRPTCCWSRCRPTSKCAQFDNDKDTAIVRQLEKDDRCRALRRTGRQDRTAGEAEGLRFDLRAARQVGDAARRQLSLHHHGRHAHRARGGAFQSRRGRGRSTISSFDLCVKLGASPNDLVPFEKYAAAAQSLTRPASAARALKTARPISSAPTSWCS